MAIQPNKPQNRVFLLVGVVLAVAAAAAVLWVISHNNTSNVASTNVVVAKSTISAGTTITADLLTLAPLPNTALPADPFSDPSQVVGKTAPVTISANVPLTQSLFTSATTAVGPGGTTVVVSHLNITKGYVAMAIPAAGATSTSAASVGVTADLTSDGYYIQPDDHIDILIDPGIPNEPGVRFAFQDVRVLRVGVYSAGTAAAAGAPSVYIVELPRNQAEMLTAMTTGRGTQLVLKYVLRPQSEYGKLDGANGYDKPVYESNTGAPLNLGADSTVTTTTLNGIFGH
ncbi:MAG: SAF domain-containing protein [Candidatus Dormibacteraeota bacterium]|nr:SAF domain-containing protein [Candidatus Dormibacteraeota bacterium]